MVTSRRALDATLVLDDLTTREDRFLCVRDGMHAHVHPRHAIRWSTGALRHAHPNRHLLWRMRTSLSTGGQVAGHESGWHGQHIPHTQRDARTPRTNAIAAVSQPRNKSSSALFASIGASMLPLSCHACHASHHLVLRPAEPPPRPLYALCACRLAIPLAARPARPLACPRCERSAESALMCVWCAVAILPSGRLSFAIRLLLL